MKILVAEDSRTEALRLRADLQAQGFDVVVAFNGRQALETAARDRPDVILSDVLMPDIDGLRLCRDLKLDPDLRDIPVVLRSAAFLDQEDHNLALAVGARAYIEKSVHGRELAQVLKEATRKNHLREDLSGLHEDTFHGAYESRLLRHLVEKAAHAERVSEDLRKTQQLLQAVMDNSPAMMWVKDLDGHYLMANKQFSQVFGVGPDEVIGKTMTALLPSEDRESFETNLRTVIQSGTAIEVEEVIHQEDGPHTWLVTRFPLKDDAGQIRAVGGISLDITERKFLEQQLLRVEKMEGLGRLASGIAHDFNNLLSIIINYATFAAEGLDESDQRARDISEVTGAATKGAELVRQLLIFSRGGLVEVETLDVNDVIREMEGLLRGALDAGIGFVTDLDPQLHPVTINRDQLGQVLLNLVVNARDAIADEGTVSLTTSDLALERALDTRYGELPAGAYVRTSVADTGSGMTEETMQRIFDPFFTTKGEGKGTGLGLSTAHGIVAGAGGVVTVDSELGRGTTFHVHLPAQQEPLPRSESSVVEAAPAETRHGSILVVDDEEGIRNMLQRALVQQGYEVIAAASEEEAIATHERGSSRIALVITDIMMPDVDGQDLAQHLVGLDPGLQVIYMSGSTGVKRELRRGALHDAPFLLKPFTIVELLAKVQRALGETDPDASGTSDS